MQHLCWASGYHIIAMPLSAGIAAALGVLLTPAVRAIGRSVSTVIVANYSRLLSAPESKTRDTSKSQDHSEPKQEETSEHKHA